VGSIWKDSVEELDGPIFFNACTHARQWSLRKTWAAGRGTTWWSSSFMHARHGFLPHMQLSGFPTTHIIEYVSPCICYLQGGVSVEAAKPGRPEHRSTRRLERERESQSRLRRGGTLLCAWWIYDCLGRYVLTSSES
jgi:hypothetical protein